MSHGAIQAPQSPGEHWGAHTPWRPLDSRPPRPLACFCAALLVRCCAIRSSSDLFSAASADADIVARLRWGLPGALTARLMGCGRECRRPGEVLGSDLGPLRALVCFGALESQQASPSLLPHAVPPKIPGNFNPGCQFASANPNYKARQPQLWRRQLARAPPRRLRAATSAARRATGERRLQGRAAAAGGSAAAAASHEQPALRRTPKEAPSLSCRSRDCTVPQSQWIPRAPPPGGWPARTPGSGPGATPTQNAAAK